MLVVKVPEREHFDDATNKFLVYPAETLKLEHSLVSLSKWESKWEKPFISKGEKSPEETLDYIRCMTLNSVSDRVYSNITTLEIDQISKYIDSPMTATTFSENGQPDKNREMVTSELIYYWMIALSVPVEFENWHLNRLLTLIRVCNIKNTPPKKASKREILNRNRNLNAARKQQLGTTG